jgi:hypothetical protein
VHNVPRLPNTFFQSGILDSVTLLYIERGTALKGRRSMLGKMGLRICLLNGGYCETYEPLAASKDGDEGLWNGRAVSGVWICFEET